ncbi:uncharacterized protein LOC132705303 [Cylas formicarius]|uniref:uncharacterized protein LOC132705303 n=1 Tax=Cylas formicarius TaxID=197179 RepID=UPI0029587813|nr:uncharacterized protein LOC132705303 [Cylas formicarius]
MMALQLLPVLQVIVILFTQGALTYPNPAVYGTKRYGRSAAHRVSYDPYDSYNLRGQPYPMSYYGFYPAYAQGYPDYYYPQDSYPLYYPRTSKYEVYQAVLPYYYKETPMNGRKLDYYNNYGDSGVDLQERLLQDIEREQRERSQPIGHEIRYENDYNNDDQNIEDINEAFVQNLVASQMYDDTSNVRNYYDPYSFDYDDALNLNSNDYLKWDDAPYDRPVSKEDEDVKELKDLTKQRKNKKHKQRQTKDNSDENIHWFQESNFRNQYQNPTKRAQLQNAVVYTDRKPIVKVVPTTEQSVATTGAPKRDTRGQKEEVLMRPATPVRHPFSNSVLDMISKQDGERKRSPSVYDTIKHMLEVEKSYEENQPKEEIRPTMRKRIISSEDSLTKQLTLLKKVH